MLKFGIGQPVPRVEDPRLLRGQGRYTDDVNLPGQAYGVALRSPHAHARIRAIDTAAALAAPGVLAVLTGADLKALGVNPLPLAAQPSDKSLARPRPLLADGTVRHVGEPVAFVVADSVAAAKDAAELVAVDYEPLNAVTGTGEALTSAVQVHDGVPANRCFHHELGDAAAVDAAFARAAHVVKLDITNSRLVANSMEPRACVADWDGQRFALHVTSQGVHLQRNLLAGAIGVQPDSIRVLTPDVGGGFGMKMFVYPEYGLTLLATRQVGRPVKWTSERQEAFLSDVHGRDNLSHAELAVDAEGRFLALRVDTIANLGAYLSAFATFIPTLAGPTMLAGVYATPAIHIRVDGVYTNTVPVDAYRGAGRPEAAYLVERLVDYAARQLGLDPAELRRRNFIQASQMPYKTPLVYTYDTGDFAACLAQALQHADRAGFEARRREAAGRGKLRGLGIATYIEACSGGGGETATVEIAPTGKVTLLIGTQNNGQGHETAYAQVLADRLGVALADITVLQGDSDRIATGGGTGGSRSIPVGGAAVAEVARQVIEKVRASAADLLEAAPVDLDYVVGDAGGRFEVAGTDRSVAFSEILRTLPAENGLVLNEAAKYTPPAQTFPNGCHAVEVEVDPDTGTVRVLRYTTVDDFGTVMNPLLLAGQVHGGIVQGLGQALHEDCVYDETGQLLTGSFQDYHMPRSDEVPTFELHFNGVPCATNALGIKGAGEAGTIGATPAVVNAVVDALAPLGITSIDMPLTPERVWRAIRQASAKAA